MTAQDRSPGPTKGQLAPHHLCVLARLMPLLGRMTYCFYFSPKTLNMNQIADEMIHWKFSSKFQKTHTKNGDWCAEAHLSEAGQPSGEATPPGALPWAAPRRVDLALRSEPCVNRHKTPGGPSGS